MNAENEAALDAGNVEGREKTDDAGTVQHGWENGEVMPVVLHSTLRPEQQPLTPERIALRAVLEWVRLCEGHVGKVTAFYAVIGEDTRRPGVIADALGICRRTFENYRNECRIWLDGFIAGLECEAVPATGAAKP